MVGGKGPQLRREPVFLPLLIGPRTFIDPRPTLAHGQIEIAIKTPVGFFLLLDSKLFIGAGRGPKLILAKASQGML